MNVYRLLPDREKYGKLHFDGQLLLENLGDETFMSFHSLSYPIADKWPKCQGWFEEWRSDDLLKNKPDIYLEDAALVLSEKAKTALAAVIRCSGELLPFTCDDETFYLLIIHPVLPVDEKNSELEIEYGNMVGTKKLSFKPEDVGTHVLFKTAYDVFLSLFCSEKFKQAVEKHQLKGLFFESELAYSI